MRFTLAVLLAAPLFGAPAFTLDQVLGSPFAGDLIASPRGDAVAWVLDSKGVRNIWVARAPGYSASAVTHFTEDDGQELSELAWAKDSSAVLFTRGGSANGRGEIPNPHSNPAGAKQEVWIAPLSGTPRKLGDGNSSAISPDGSMAVWVSGAQIWSVALPAGNTPSQLIHARGTAEEPLWAPDGARLAFRSSRTDHAFIGVYTVR